MSRETLNLMLGLDRGALETQVILQCAPLLTGLKPSNLLAVERQHKSAVARLFSGTAISCYLLFESEERIVFLLYIRERLEACLQQPEAERLMRRLHCGGEVPEQLEALLCRVAVSYQSYMDGRADFPHEIGLLLGYPPGDVSGFIENEGKNFLYIGYWKVYTNLTESKRTFDSYNRAREKVIRMMSGGQNVRSILACHQLHRLVV